MLRKNLRRTDLMDVSDETHRMIVGKLRTLTPHERMRMTLERIEFMRAIRATTAALRPVR